jgi:long-subunit acyl-CoA synthetase (AMP-forming)
VAATRRDGQRPAARHADEPVEWAGLLAAGDSCRASARLGRSDAHWLCALVYTSGTTGLPKGVSLSNWNLLHNLISGWHIGSIRAGDRTASFLPWSHAFGATLDLHFMLAHGIIIIIIIISIIIITIMNTKLTTRGAVWRSSRVKR